MSRKKPGKSSRHRPQGNVKNRPSPVARDEGRYDALRQRLRDAAAMPAGPEVEAIYEDVAAEAKQLGGGTADGASSLRRVYLEARLGLAANLWRECGPESAIGAFQELLEVDPADHVLARNWLVAILLELNRNEEASALLRRFEDPSAHWQPGPNAS